MVLHSLGYGEWLAQILEMILAYFASNRDGLLSNSDVSDVSVGDTLLIPSKGANLLMNISRTHVGNAVRLDPPEIHQIHIVIDPD